MSALQNQRFGDPFCEGVGVSFSVLEVAGHFHMRHRSSNELVSRHRDTARFGSDALTKTWITFVYTRNPKRSQFLSANHF